VAIGSDAESRGLPASAKTATSTTGGFIARVAGSPPVVA
jgi:hypothetical protein